MIHEQAMTGDCILARYLIETPHSIARALDKMLSLQSTGTFTAVPGETDTLKRRFAIDVTDIVPLDPVARASLPSWDYRIPVTDTTRFNRAEITLSIPLALTGTDLTTLLATVAGGVFGLSELSGIRLLDLRLPPVFGEVHPVWVRKSQSAPDSSVKPRADSHGADRLALDARQCAHHARTLGSGHLHVGLGCVGRSPDAVARR